MATAIIIVKMVTYAVQNDRKQVATLGELAGFTLKTSKIRRKTSSAQIA